MQEITKQSRLVSANGGQIDYVDGSTGELLLSVAVPAGAVPALPFLELAPAGSIIEVAEGIAVVNPRSWVGIQSYGEGSHDSGANPDFAPTSASRLEREMRVTLARMQATTARLDARERALASIERIPTAPAQSEPELIEAAGQPEGE